MGRSVSSGEATGWPALLLLADGRFPAGGHAHSGGFEAAAALEGITDLTGVEAYLLGRLHTVGFVAAAFSAAACTASTRTDPGPDLPTRLRVLDEELDARTPAPALRASSRRLGRQLVRAGRTIWPDTRLDAIPAAFHHGLHHAVALGIVAAAADVTPAGAALAAAHDSAMGPATAAVRLLGLDPFAVHAALARLAPDIAAVASRAAGYAHAAPAELPACSAPLADIAAEDHATWEVRLFAS